MTDRASRGVRTRAPRRLRRQAWRSNRGAVTAEAAAVLPLLAALTIALVWLLALLIIQVRIVDAAREVARAAARGDDIGTVQSLGQRVAPVGSRIEVETGDEVRATVRVRVRAPGLFSFLPRVTLSAVAIAAPEPGVPA